LNNWGLAARSPGGGMHRYISGGGQGVGRLRNKGAGGVREAGGEGAESTIPKVAGSRRKSEKLCNISQYFATGKVERGRSQQNFNTCTRWELGLKGMGNGRFKPPLPLHPHISDGEVQRIRPNFYTQKSPTFQNLTLKKPFLRTLRYIIIHKLFINHKLSPAN